MTDTSDTRQSPYRPFTAALWQWLPRPPKCDPGDHTTALEYVQAIERVWLDHQAELSPYERQKVRRLLRRWTRRASGNDPRYEVAGTQDGRLPAAVEYSLRPKIRRAKFKDRATRSQPQDGRRRRYEPGINADLPTGQARGSGASLDPEFQASDPEAGDIALPTPTQARQYLIPGQDSKGHSQRVWCRIMPAHYRALCAIERDRAFGFRTVGDVIRWCIDFGVRELTARTRQPQARSALAQADVIREVVLNEQYYQRFPGVFDELHGVITKHIADGAEGEAIRVIGMVRHLIESMDEPYWREKYMANFMRQYGSYLDGSRGQDFAFGTESEE